MPSNLRQQAAYVSSGDPESVDDVTAYAPGMLGARVGVTPTAAGTARTGPTKVYQYVKGDSAMSVSPFAQCLLYWQDADKYVVTTATTNLNRVAGVYHKTGGPSNKGNYFFIQVEGRSLVRFIDAPTSAPDATGKYVVANAANAGKVDSIVTAPTIAVIGVTAGAQDGTSKEALVDLALPANP